MASDSYTTVSNAFARDARLSFKARGVGLWLFSQATGWELSIRSIAAQNGCGTESVMTALQELEAHGYLRREPQDRTGGRFGDVTYIVTDLPAASGKPEHGDGVPVNRVRANRVRANRVRETGTHKKTKFQEDQDQEDQKDHPSPDGDAVPDDGALFPVASPAATRLATQRAYEAEFTDQFWPLYPRKVGKLAAQAAFARARRNGATLEQLMAGAAEFAKAVAGRPAQYIAHATTWLNGGRWMDEAEVAVSGAPRSNGHKPYQNDDYWSTP